MTLAHATTAGWDLQPGGLAILLAVTALYWIGLHTAGARPVSNARAASFAAGIVVVAVATMSPLHAAAEQRFSLHMLQHQVLMLVAAPLIVWSRPTLVTALALPRRARAALWSLGRRRLVAGLGGLARNPIAILVAYSSALWIWHLPAPYQAAVRNESLHVLEHACFLGVALAFWSALMRTGPRRRVAFLPAMALVVGSMILTSWLAAALTFGRLAYPVYGEAAAILRIDPVADQEVAGAIMWVPGAIVSVVLFGRLFVQWIREMDRRHERRPVAAVEP